MAVAALVVASLTLLMPGAGAEAQTAGAVRVHGPDRGSVERLYRAYFLRAPEANGLAYWHARRMNATGLDRVSAHFAVSPEFVARYGHLGDQDFVRLVYQNVLGRAPDPGGLSHWTSHLTRHPDGRGRVMLGFSDSPEFKAQTSSGGGCDRGGPGPGSPYAQSCWVAGVQILASDAVDPEALHAAADLIYAVLGPRPAVSGAMAGTRVLIAAPSEKTSSVPDLALYIERTGMSFRDTVRGVWIPDLKATVVGEENLLCLPRDNYAGESVLLHEISHGVHLVAIPKVDPSFNRRLDAAYAAAMAASIWGETYATANAHEYFAEGVQSYFDANKHGTGWKGLHGPISNRHALATADPVLHELVREVFGEPRWEMPC